MIAAAHLDREPEGPFVRVALPDAEPLAMTMTEVEFASIENGVGGAQELIRDAGEVFDYLATSLVCGYMSGDDVPLAAILRLSARAMKTGANAEIEALDLADMKLRVARLRANGGIVK